MMGRQCRPAAAFTLAEILILVAVLAVLAAMIGPRLVEAGTDARLAQLTRALHTVRGQLHTYRLHHDGGYPTAARFTEQMTLHTDLDGATSRSKTRRFNLGPYLTAVPINPFTGTSDLTADTLCTDVAWLYDEQTGEFRANDSPEHAGY